jgi:hypothetical protein
MHYPNIISSIAERAGPSKEALEKEGTDLTYAWIKLKGREAQLACELKYHKALHIEDGDFDRRDREDTVQELIKRTHEVGAEIKKNTDRKNEIIRLLKQFN